MRKVFGLVFVLSILLIGACVERTSILGDPHSYNWVGRMPGTFGNLCPLCGV